MEPRTYTIYPTGSIACPIPRWRGSGWPGNRGVCVDFDEAGLPVTLWVDGEPYAMAIDGPIPDRDDPAAHNPDRPDFYAWCETCEVTVAHVYDVITGLIDPVDVLMEVADHADIHPTHRED